MHKLSPNEAEQFVRTVRQEISANLANGQVSIEHAARAVGVSVRTLQQQLASAGLSRSQLVDQVRLEMAQRLLSDPAMHLAQIACTVGYTHHSSFSRAFRRWTGHTPQMSHRKA